MTVVAGIICNPLFLVSEKVIGIYLVVEGWFVSGVDVHRRVGMTVIRPDY
jgi:hypothetical protein